MPRILLCPPPPVHCPACGGTYHGVPPPPSTPDPPGELSPAGNIAVALARLVVARIRREVRVAPSPPPEPGDFTICHYCSDILRFTADRTLESLPADDWWALPEEQREELRRLQYRLLLPSPRD